jgi:hypothetical protein
MDRWEYKQITVTTPTPAPLPPSTMAALDEAGREGWEAVGLASTWGHGVVVLLKRRLRNN